MTTAFVAYSTASSNIIGYSTTLEFAKTIFANPFAVVLECPLAQAERLNSWDIPPSNAKIVWRGENELAQRFRIYRKPR
jgi:hypothetical protein